MKGPVLRSLISWNGAPTLMPSSQALLLWIKEALPQHFATVLARAKEIEAAGGQAVHS